MSNVSIPVAGRPTSGIRRLIAKFLRPMIADRALFRERPFPGVLFFIWTYPFTPAGKVVMLALTLSGIAGAITDEMPIYQLPVALLVLVMVTSGASSVMRWLSVTISGEWPDHVTAGQTVRAEFTVHNDTRFPVLDVSIACFNLPKGWQEVREERIVPTLAPGESAKLTLRAVAKRRGRYSMPWVRAFSTFPFNLFRNQLGRKESRPVLVLPRFAPLHRINLEVGNRYQPGGISFTSQIGESPEYIGNREYTPGDSPRHIDFRSWARLAKPIVREFQEEYFHRLGLVLDTTPPPSRFRWQRGDRELEAAISLTAAIADLFSRGEYLLDVFAVGPELHLLRTGRSTAPIDSVLEILAAVPINLAIQFDQLNSALAVELPNISSIVCVLLGWDDSRRRLVKLALDSGCQAKIIIIQQNREVPVSLEFPNVDIVCLTPEQIENGIGEL